MQQPGKIHECVYLVGGPELTDRRDCCVYLIDGRSELALIDTGLGYSVQAILNNIKKLGLDSSLLKYVVATHGHIDHIGGLHQFQALGAKVVAHELEYDAIARGLSRLTAESYYRVQYQPVSIDLLLRGEEDDLTVGDLTLHCPFTPGHTPGGLAPIWILEGSGYCSARTSTAPLTRPGGRTWISGEVPCSNFSVLRQIFCARGTSGFTNRRTRFKVIFIIIWTSTLMTDGESATNSFKVNFTVWEIKRGR